MTCTTSAAAGKKRRAVSAASDMTGPSDPPSSQPSPSLSALLAEDGAGANYGLRQCRYGPMLFNRRDRYVGRSLEVYGEYSDWEIVVLRQILRPGAIIVEAGANIGAHTVPLARIAGPEGAVHAYEPQRLQFQLLCANLALNGLTNVIARPEALGAAPGRLRVPWLDPAAEHNFGGVSLETQGEGEIVSVATIDGLGLRHLDLLKADVEGMEQAVLAGGRETIGRSRPVLYVECDRRDRAPALIRTILDHGYRAWWHLPLYFNPGNYAGNPENFFPNHVSCNLLALPAERAGLSSRRPPASRPRPAT